MDKINLFLMDMSSDSTTSGVDRYLSVLTRGLRDYPSINICRIHLLHSPSLLFYTENHTEYGLEVTIPLPQKKNEIIREFFWAEKYNEVVYHLTGHLFENKTNVIIHAHTLNLIDLASFIKKRISCKIIMHMHCIPWKSLYNYDRRKFNSLYELAYIKKEIGQLSELFIEKSEMRSYTEPDLLICVTNCARDFLESFREDSFSPVDVIPNGMEDYRTEERAGITSDKIVELLYVGVVSESKGLFYILDALRIVLQRGYKVTLNVAGKVFDRELWRIERNYPDLSVNMPGLLSFDKLKEYYQKCDIGVIASLQEQASYAAIEMAMFGLPIITTAVDGLDEMFEDNVNALKVNTSFSKANGLTVDVPMLADKIINLLNDKDKRLSLGRNARTLYENKWSLEKMIHSTVLIYKQINT